MVWRSARNTWTCAYAAGRSSRARKPCLRVTNGPSMKQSKRMSLVESLTNVAVGYGLAVMVQILVFPWFDLPVRLVDSLMIGAVFTVVSIARSYVLRRVFEALR